MRKIAIAGAGLLIATAWAGLFAQQAGGDKALAKAQKAERELGAKLYVKYSCGSCHGNKGKAQGDLTAAYDKYNDEQLKSYIKNPVKFGNYKMPVYSDIISEEDYKPLLAYIKWLGIEARNKKK
jgi:mono/diheme cytochrome c family protein